MGSTVSVIIPCYNEERTIGLVLEALAAQTFPLGRMEVLVVDGGSSDGTRRRIAEFAARHPAPRVGVLENRRRIIPAALNLGIARAKGDYIVRLDAHSIPAPDYVERCVALLESGTGEEVGGRWEFRAAKASALAAAIVAAVSHPFGSGDAAYRYSLKAGYVDTVPFGAFRRSLFDEIGPYDESLLANEDYDLNYRLRAAGGRVYLSPDIVSTYYPRSTLSSLVRQYYRYGWWKVRMLRKWPRSVRWRQLVPPAFVASLVGLGIGGLLARPIGFLWAASIVAYLVAAGLVALSAAIRGRCGRRSSLWLPVVFAAIHLSWGAGFWASVIDSLLSRPRFGAPKA